MGGNGSVTRRPRAIRSLRIVIASAVVALGIAGVASRATSFGGEDLVRNEFTQDYVSARALSDGHDPYAPAQELADRYLAGEDAYVVRNPHPPAQILLAQPLSGLSYRVARAIWLVMQAVAIAAAVAIVMHGFGWSVAISSVVGIGALAAPVVQKELLYGNLNGLLLLLLALAWRALRRDRPISAGAMVGLAAAIKLFPLFMVIPLLRQRRRSAVVAMALTAAFVTALAFVIVGFESVTGLRASLSENASYWRAAPINISLVAEPYRWLTSTMWQRGVVDSPVLAHSIAVLIVGLCAFAALRTSAARTRDTYWAATPWMILASPLAWDWYLVLAIPAAIAMLASARAVGTIPSVVVLLPIALLAIGAPPGLPLPGQPIGVVPLVLGFGLPTIALVAMASVDAVKVGTLDVDIGSSRPTPS